MADISFEAAVILASRKDTRYQPAAYDFVRESLHIAVKKFCAGDEAKHVSGQQLLEGVRDHALREFGPMSLTILNLWGLTCGKDVGNIVYNLIGAGYFGRNDGDSLEDFDGGYAFEEAFVSPFLPSTQQKRPNGKQRS